VILSLRQFKPKTSLTRDKLIDSLVAREWIEPWSTSNDRLVTRSAKSLKSGAAAGGGHQEGVTVMLLKLALALALGSLGVVLMNQLRQSKDRTILAREVEAELDALRDYLFGR
jgi:hypothetical protein